MAWLGVAGRGGAGQGPGEFTRLTGTAVVTLGGVGVGRRAWGMGPLMGLAGAGQGSQGSQQ